MAILHFPFMHWLKKIIILAFVLFALFFGAGFYLFQKIHAPSAQTVELTIEPGTSIKGIGRALEQGGVIEDALIFELLSRLTGKGRLFQAGDYEFPAGSTSLSAMTLLMEGRVKLTPLTIPEGYNLKTIGALLVEKKRVESLAQWNQITRDRDLIAGLGVPATHLEGYIYPDTYLLDKKTKGLALVKMMVGLFDQKVTPQMRQQAIDAGFTLHQWVTLASIVEKETGLASERPLIASVFINRLKLGMLLQTDPTVIYGIPNYNGNITREDLLRDTPYNTYTRPGLPPGPICSPGLDALMAVLNPTPTDFLYFVAKGDGSHYFSNDLDTHNRAVNYFQRKSGPPPP